MAGFGRVQAVMFDVVHRGVECEFRDPTPTSVMLRAGVVA